MNLMPVAVAPIFFALKPWQNVMDLVLILKVADAGFYHQIWIYALAILKNVKTLFLFKSAALQEEVSLPCNSSLTPW